MNIPLFLLVGLLAGVLSGVFGIGGGIVIVPALVFIVGFHQTAAAGTSLVALLLPVGLGGVLSYYQAGKIDGTHIKAGFLIAAGMVVGSFFGARIAMLCSELMLKRLFAVFLLVVAVKTWLSAR